MENIRDIENKIVDDLDEQITDNPWCWITRKGKFLNCPWHCHSSVLHSMFTDDLNPDDAPYTIDCGVHYTNYERFFELNWVKISDGLIWIPKGVTGKQKIAVEKVLSEFPDINRKADTNYYNICGDSPYYVLIKDDNKFSWEKF